MPEIEPVYNSRQVEGRIYDFWETKGYFSGRVNSQKKPFSVVIPPPNITGILHMGHVMDNTPQDIMIRFRRMQGFETTWIPGTDHAGIATQNAVEKKLAEKGLKRTDLGRDKFIERVWQWKEQYGNTIIQQLKRLGCSCDWPRLRFTMDPEYSQAVTDVFCRLHKKGLIYRGNYIINWCPRCRTALSDEEVEHREIEGGLYWIKYPVKELKNEDTKKPKNKSLRSLVPSSFSYITVATTRPETMLGDTAVAVHPSDKRYKNLIGATVILPVLNREIPVIKDNFVDSAFGSGAVKVTPAHDPNDFAIAQRHRLAEIIAIDADGRMNENAGTYRGLDRFACRKQIVADLAQQGLLEKQEKYVHSVGHCYRCETIVEPYLSRQWFVKMTPLAKPAIEAVKKERVKFFPERWTKVYMEWMTNIRDWCISRQLWWGHQIPAWYCQKTGGPAVQQFNGPTDKQTGLLPDYRTVGLLDCPPIVSPSVPEQCPHCGNRNLARDPDVLDTWFSSWLWPFVVFGWPEKPKDEKKETLSDFKYFYPTGWLNSGKDILFFWVARMIMAGLEFTNDVPFRHVYIHGIARDEQGRKLSKSLGNSPDPMNLIEQYGADALRFGIMANIPLGGDISLADQVYVSGRNFCNKLWNASRLVLMNIVQQSNSPTIQPSNKTANGWTSELSDCWTSFEDRWIISRLNSTIQAYTKALETYEFSQAAQTVYHFFWGDLCDWYLEMIKPRLYQKDALARKTLCHLFNNVLRLLHPFIPFITEELWQKFRNLTGDRLFTEYEAVIIAAWPASSKNLIDHSLEKDMDSLINLIKSIRDIRNKTNIDQRKPLNVIISVHHQNYAKLIGSSLSFIRQLGYLNEVTVGSRLKKPAHSAAAVLAEAEVFVPLEGIIDLAAEKKRLENQLNKIKEQVSSLKKKTSNREFITRAPAEVVNKEKQKLTDLTEQFNKLNRNLKDL